MPIAPGHHPVEPDTPDQQEPIHHPHKPDHPGPDHKDDDDGDEDEDDSCGEPWWM